MGFGLVFTVFFMLWWFPFVSAQPAPQSLRRLAPSLHPRGKTPSPQSLSSGSQISSHEHAPVYVAQIEGPWLGPLPLSVFAAHPAHSITPMQTPEGKP